MIYKIIHFSYIKEYSNWIFNGLKCALLSLKTFFPLDHFWASVTILFVAIKKTNVSHIHFSRILEKLNKRCTSHYVLWWKGALDAMHLTVLTNANF
jgi:hypothetical protein